jgi:mRNA interferase MazF
VSVPIAATRGQVYWATIEGRRKPWLVVSNNPRNRALGSCLAVRLSTSAKPSLASIVELHDADRPLTGRVLCDDIAVLYPDEDGFEYLSALTPATMRRVDDGLRVALALT